MIAKKYAVKLSENIVNLLEKMKSGRYKAPPVRRVWIEKEDKSKRPIGIPCLEDKIVQRAVTKILEAVYEQEFYDFSYGFRAGRSPHQALNKLRNNIMDRNIGWIIDADISGFFDNIDHEKLKELVKQRVNDGTIIRFSGKWLNAGVMEEGRLSYRKQGTPQGGVISPMLANIYLHYVLDKWYDEVVKPRLKWRSFLVRFADDFVMGCEKREDAERVMKVLPKRFKKYKLKIHPDKTKLIKYKRPPKDAKKDRGNSTFDFLGFTHYLAKSRNGNWAGNCPVLPRKIC